MNRLWILPLAVTTAIVTACGGSGGGPSATPRNRDLITRAQIDSMNVQDVYEVVQRMRPEYLRERGATSMQSIAVLPVVYVDGARRGGPGTLRQFRSYDVEEIRFVSGVDATTRYGTDHVAGAIEIKTRQGVRR